MNSILITGATGFVGENLSKYLQSYSFQVITYRRNSALDLTNINALIHLAGKAHDLKNISVPKEYYDANFELTKKIYDEFLTSDVKKFIFISSVKASADKVEGELTEQHHPNPITHYGISKLLAEQYILSKDIPHGKIVYILRPCMIHGPGNKGNLNLLYNLVTKGIPWPLGAFENQRSFCSIDNLNLIFKELIEREDIPSGIYNIADDEPLSTNELVKLIAKSHNGYPKVWKISRPLIEIITRIGDKLHLPLNTERLHKLTSSYLVSNAKIKAAIGKPLPVSSREGLLKTFKSFNC